MKKITVMAALLLAVFGLGGCVGTARNKVKVEAPQSPEMIAAFRFIQTQKNVDHLRGSTIAFVERGSSGEDRAYCTGFFISRTLIASAAHCFERPDPAIPLFTSPGRIGNTFRFHTYQQYTAAGNRHAGTSNTAILTGINVERDVALLTTDSASEEFLTVNTGELQVGARVFAVGQPGGLPWVLSEGIISQFDRGTSNRVNGILASAPIYFGSSGGPLVDNNGNVIGVAGAIMFRQPVFGYFYPIRFVSALIPSSR